MIFKKINVLIIEDNPAHVKEIYKLLEPSNSINFNLTHIGKLSEAVKNLKNDNNYDIILLDLLLPDSLGLDTLLETLKVALEIPIIVLTGTDNDTLAITSVKKGAQDYLVKGQFKSVGLIRAIQYAIERKTMEKKLKNSELIALKAYERVNFYKDLFLYDINNAFENISEAIEQISVNIEDNIRKYNCIDKVKVIENHTNNGLKIVSNVHRLFEKDRVLFEIFSKESKN